jgi:hypothetical protein
MAANYYVCDHPELLTKDNLCHLCNELAGQLDLLEEINETA